VPHLQHFLLLLLLEPLLILRLESVYGCTGMFVRACVCVSVCVCVCARLCV